MNIQIPILFRGSKSNKELLAIFDPETLYSFLPESFIEEIGRLSQLPNPRLLKIASKDQQLLITHGTCAGFTINNLKLSDEFMSFPGNLDHAIIGITTIRKWRMKLDPENNAVIINPEVAKFRLGGLRPVKF
ncbi:MAG TPA: hypothetical protein VHM26_12900 [Chitinophagaceae bacterium]|jgi:hypothetical protein|nr:hypothetical protein [Chitinophagaceae bacterium]